MQKVLLRLLSILFYILFLGFFILIFPFHFLFLLTKSRRLHNASHFLNKMWGWIIMYPVGVWLKNINRKVVKRKQVYIFAPNHTSYLDIPICNVSIPITFRFMGKAELNSLPLFGYMFKRLHIPVDRGSRSDSYRSFTDAKAKLEEGTSVLIYPEGTIPDKTRVDLLRFKEGAFRLAIETGTPLVPMTVIGGAQALPDNGKYIIHPTWVKVIYHDPIETKGMDISEAGALKQRVFELMKRTLAEHGALLEQQAEAATPA